MTAKLICTLETAMHRAMQEKQYSAVVSNAKVFVKLVGFEAKIKELRWCFGKTINYCRENIKKVIQKITNLSRAKLKLNERRIEELTDTNPYWYLYTLEETGEVNEKKIQKGDLYIFHYYSHINNWWGC